MELREWSRWTASLLIVGSLFWTIEVLAADLEHGIGFIQQQQLGINLNCLLTLVLLFSVYSIYQQFVIARDRTRLFRETSRSGVAETDPSVQEHS